MIQPNLKAEIMLAQEHLQSHKVCYGDFRKKIDERCNMCKEINEYLAQVVEETQKDYDKMLNICQSYVCMSCDELTKQVDHLYNENNRLQKTEQSNQRLINKMLNDAHDLLSVLKQSKKRLKDQNDKLSQQAETNEQQAELMERYKNAAENLIELNDLRDQECQQQIQQSLKEQDIKFHKQAQTTTARQAMINTGKYTLMPTLAVLTASMITINNRKNNSKITVILGAAITGIALTIFCNISTQQA